MRLAIMQPYFFPYLGYFQLINAVDKFIVYDDVSFIKQGWINRNRILANGVPLMFSVPLSGVSSHTSIRETLINTPVYAVWRKKFFKTLEQYYRKLPHYEQVLSIISDVLAGEHMQISALATHSIKAVCAHLSISTEIVETASHYGNAHLKAEERVVDICQLENARVYVNSVGGQELYSHETFRGNGIDLKFLKPNKIKYKQFHYPFVPWLSIIDVLMFNSTETLQQMISQYELV
jgi:hypothetical protein